MSLSQESLNQEVMVDTIRGYIDADTFDNLSALVHYLVDAGYVRTIQLGSLLSLGYAVEREVVIQSQRRETYLSMGSSISMGGTPRYHSMCDLVDEIDVLFFAGENK